MDGSVHRMRGRALQMACTQRNVHMDVGQCTTSLCRDLACPLYSHHAVMSSCTVHQSKSSSQIDIERRCTHGTMRITYSMLHIWTYYIWSPETTWSPVTWIHYTWVYHIDNISFTITCLLMEQGNTHLITVWEFTLPSVKCSLQLVIVNSVDSMHYR